MFYLRDHLLPGSFRPSYADTDSMCLGLSRTRPIPENATPEEFYRCLFDPLVRPEKRESWESTWKDWFVTTNEVEDQRKPGKLKSKIRFSTTKITDYFRRIQHQQGTLCRIVAKVLLHLRSRLKRSEERHERHSTQLRSCD